MSALGTIRRLETRLRKKKAKEEKKRAKKTLATKIESLRKQLSK